MKPRNYILRSLDLPQYVDRLTRAHAARFLRDLRAYGIRVTRHPATGWQFTSRYGVVVTLRPMPSARVS